MTKMFRVHVVLLAIVMCGESRHMDGGEFFCRDPDTGKLYAVNATWRSTTFCGNYHCMIRLKNLTSNEHLPIRQFNVTHVKTNYPSLQRKHFVNKPTNIKTISPDTSDDKTHKHTAARQEQISSKDPVLDNDRLLTDKEIKTITTVLHTIRKSDLDAVIEMYNLAHDIYREIDKTVDDVIGNNNMSRKAEPIKLDNKERVSYWYDPLNYGKTRDIVQNNGETENPLLSSYIEVTTKAINIPQFNVTMYKNKSQTSPNLNESHFKGRLSEKDFGKLPYFNTVLNFRRPTYGHELKAPINKFSRQPNDMSSQLLDTILARPLPYSITYKTRSKPSKYSTSKDKVPQKTNKDPDYKEKEMKILKLNHEKNIQHRKPGLKLHEYDWQKDPMSQQILKEARNHLEQKTRYLKPLYLRRQLNLERVEQLIKFELNTRSKRVANNSGPELYEVYIENTT